MTGRFLESMTLVAVLAAVGCGKGAKSYPDGVDGLKSFMTDLAAADEATGGQMAESLVLTDPDAWFKNYFGDPAGKVLADEYTRGLEGGAKGLAVAARAQKAKGNTEFLVERFDKASDPNAVGYQEGALQAAKQPLALYSFRALAPGKQMGWHLYNFVYLDGAWKFAGPMTGLKPDLRSDPKLDAVSGLRAKDRDEFFRSGKLPE
jgi:hypothetical protein